MIILYMQARSLTAPSFAAARVAWRPCRMSSKPGLADMIAFVRPIRLFLAERCNCLNVRFAVSW